MVLEFLLLIEEASLSCPDNKRRNGQGINVVFLVCLFSKARDEASSEVISWIKCRL